MTTAKFDPTSVLESYRSSFAPLMHAQQEGLKAVDRLVRYQYAVAGDYVEWSLSYAKAFVNAKNPAEYFAKQTELGSKIGDQLRGRVQEFSTLANDAQTTITQLIDEATSKFAEVTKKAA